VMTTARRAKKTSAGYDLTRLMVGSEGTLGVITELTLRLHPIPEHIVVARAAFPSIESACRAAAATIGSGVPVTRCELLDAMTIAALPALTLTQIMTQKYIAQWGWGHNELWMDMRRYHYTDIDPVSGTEVFRGFAPPTNLYVDNGGKIVQRIRPRFNSEYVWNRAGLDVIGGLALDYHTVPLWITQP